MKYSETTLSLASIFPQKIIKYKEETRERCTIKSTKMQVIIYFRIIRSVVEVFMHVSDVPLIHLRNLHPYKYLKNRK